MRNFARGVPYGYMLLDRFFKAKKQHAELVQLSLAKEAKLQARLEVIKKEHATKMNRQVELWSIMNLESDLEEEYMNITKAIANLVKEQAAINEYLYDLLIANATCQESGNCIALESLLKIDDPWQAKIDAGLADALPRVLPT